tara:strand:+ start:1790 stop:2278 length:489 start_codon:yes stop_codon:yes gene_type:complete
MNKLTALGYPRLAEAGYEFDGKNVKAPGACQGDVIRDPDLLDKLEGRLSNVDYMAHAIDIFDTARSNVPGTPAGNEQFAHLMRRENLVWHGLLYVALRRFQREGRNDALRAGLAMLISTERGIIAGRDAVQAMAPDLVQMQDIRDDDGGKQLERQAQLPATA